MPERLAQDLSGRFGRGFSYPNLNRFRQFYMAFPADRKLSTPSRESRQGVYFEEEELIAKLRKVEALFARPATPGGRAAAGNARGRILARLRQLESFERPAEYRFTLQDPWSRRLFVALLRRYGIEHYRYRGQRWTTLNAKVTKSFVDEVLWPEFKALAETLREHLDAVTERVIAQAIHSGGGDVEERRGREPPARTGETALGME